MTITYTKPRIRRADDNSFWLFARSEHTRSTKMLGYALTAASFDGWVGASVVWACRLNDQERVALAWAALRALSTGERKMLFDSFEPLPVTPLAPIFSPVQDARWWAATAYPAELDAYALAAVEAMEPDRRRAFIAFLGREAGS